VIMVVFLPDYVSEPVRQWEGARAAERARGNQLFPGDPDAARNLADAWVKANPRPTTSIGEVADHIDHIRTTIGIDHVGLGGDYDGMDSAPVGMEDVSGYPALFVELARRGYSQADLEKISSGNVMRVIRAAEAYAASQKGRLPIETPVVK
jgi:membrane dipeptidase